MASLHVKAVRTVLGILFLILGILGFFLPFLQGILFTGIGLILLAPVYPPFERLLRMIERKYPKFGNIIESSENKIDKMVEWTYEATRKPYVIATLVALLIAVIYWIAK